MSKFKGTPGPWSVDGSVIRGDADHIGRTVAVASTLNVAWPFGRRAIKEEPYNAHLIAAAPKLLDAAIMAIEHYDAYFGGSAPDDLPWVPVMREAIKEALGEDAP